MAAFLHPLDKLRPGHESFEPASSASRPRVGLVLSSGGAKGLAHIGVIQVLEENGIEVDVVAGTSMGAYVGGLFAAGFNGKELESFAADMTRKRDLLDLVDPVFPPRRGFLRGRSIYERLDKSLQGKTFAELEKPFLAVATEFETLERAVIRTGEVASAIVASLAVPGVVVPVVRNGVEYIDGGVCDPLPVSLAKKTWDLDHVIAVNVLPPIGSLREAKAGDRGSRVWLKPLQFLNRHLNYFARGNLLDILRAAAMGSQMRLVGKSAREADVLISPMSPKSGWHDYHRYADYIEIGRAAALEALPKIKALLGKEKSVAPELPTLNRIEMSCI
ncbi:MAG: patatin-like phospholipase family protein [Verrucomicrobiales bacterium]|nr:patatin-like phospholipase family protein [Verrucomicrobiales bacterium]